MEIQANAIRRIDEQSDYAVQNVPVHFTHGRGLMFFRIAVLPKIVFFQSLWKAGPRSGLAGLQTAVNDFVLCVVTEAKRYEMLYRDDREMRKKTGDIADHPNIH